jgi:hypothetical protein
LAPLKLVNLHLVPEIRVAMLRLRKVNLFSFSFEHISQFLLVHGFNAETSGTEDFDLFLR